MFGDNNQDQNAPVNKSWKDPAAAPTTPTNSSLPSFTMDPPAHSDIPSLPPTRAAAIEPPSPPPPLKDIDSYTNDSNSKDENASSSSGDNSKNSELLELKQQAIAQLTPLVSHLDQSPEEKYRTLVMMIQATDNQALVKEAYAAAEQITDEKIKAQALLDIVNEINYFTQPPKQTTD